MSNISITATTASTNTYTFTTSTSATSSCTPTLGSITFNPSTNKIYVYSGFPYSTATKSNSMYEILDRYIKMKIPSQVKINNKVMYNKITTRTKQRLFKNLLAKNNKDYDEFIKFAINEFNKNEKEADLSTLDNCINILSNKREEGWFALGSKATQPYATPYTMTYSFMPMTTIGSSI